MSANQYAQDPGYVTSKETEQGRIVLYDNEKMANKIAEATQRWVLVKQPEGKFLADVASRDKAREELNTFSANSNTQPAEADVVVETTTKQTTKKEPKAKVSKALNSKPVEGAVSTKSPAKIVEMVEGRKEIMVEFPYDTYPKYYGDGNGNWKKDNNGVYNFHGTPYRKCKPRPDNGCVAVKFQGDYYTLAEYDVDTDTFFAKKQG